MDFQWIFHCHVWLPEGKRASTALLTWDVHILAPWRSLSQGDCSKLGRILSHVDKPDFLAQASNFREVPCAFHVLSASNMMTKSTHHWRPPSTRMATTWPRWAFPAWSYPSGRSCRTPWKKSCSRCWKICRTGRCAPRFRADFGDGNMTRNMTSSLHFPSSGSYFISVVPHWSPLPILPFDCLYEFPIMINPGWKDLTFRSPSMPQQPTGTITLSRHDDPLIILVKYHPFANIIRHHFTEIIVSHINNLPTLQE